MNEGLYSILVGTAGLSAAALIALLLTVTRTAGESDPAAQRRMMRLVTWAIVLQGLHFVEELITGFPERFPDMLGLHPWPVTFFVSFNLFWIAVWGLSLVGLQAHWRAAFFPLWFLSLGGVANGLAHPLFAVVEGGYFPGLWTSPLVGIAGILLLHRLVSFTQTERTPLRPA